MRLRFLLIPLVLIALSFAFIACSGDDDDDGGDDGGDQPTQTAAPDNGDSGDDDDGNSGDDDDGGSNPLSGSGGSLTLTIGDETWTSDDVFCAFSTEETRNENVPFTVSGFTETSTGARAQIDASVVDLSGSGEISAENLSVSIDDIDDFENPSESWLSFSQEVLGGSPPTLQIDGKNVTIEAVFDDNTTDGEFESVPGTLTAECP
jgi:hypothetical protein